MRICSVTLAGPGTEGIIGDALRSVVEWVDACVVLGTGIVSDAVPHPNWNLATGRRNDGPDVHFIEHVAWRDDFSAMRNLALSEAAKLTCDWAVMLDTDERIIDGQRAREILERAPEDVCAISAFDVTGQYAKERFFRLPQCGRFIGLTHEFWQPDVGQRTGQTKQVRFDELPRDRDSASWRDKLDRDARLLAQQRKVDPDEPRWDYYQGETAYLQGNEGHAIACWKRAMRKPGGWPEVKGWAAFRAANALLGRQQAREALEVATAGMRVSPYPELLWAAAAACYDLGDFGNAVHWAQHCAAAGKHVGWGGEIDRSGYLWPPALYHAPLEIMHLSYSNLGREDLAELAKDEAQKARMKLERLSHNPQKILVK